MSIARCGPCGTRLRTASLSVGCRQLWEPEGVCWKNTTCLLSSHGRLNSAADRRNRPTHAPHTGDVMRLAANFGAGIRCGTAVWAIWFGSPTSGGGPTGCRRNSSEPRDVWQDDGGTGDGGTGDGGTGWLNGLSISPTTTVPGRHPLAGRSLGCVDRPTGRRRRSSTANDRGLAGG